VLQKKKSVKKKLPETWPRVGIPNNLTGTAKENRGKEFSASALHPKYGPSFSTRVPKFLKTPRLSTQFLLRRINFASAAKVELLFEKLREGNISRRGFQNLIIRFHKRNKWFPKILTFFPSNSKFEQDILNYVFFPTDYSSKF
jgi:hypothetical protein